MVRILSLMTVMGVVLAAAALLPAQNTVVVLGTTGSSNVIPFNLTGTTWGMSGRYQTAYSQSEINIPGGATLIEVRVYMANGTVTTYDNFRLRVAHTTSNPTALSATFAQNYTGTLDEVIGPANFAPTPVTVGAEPYASFPLTTHWPYNGTDGLLLDFSFDNMAGAGFGIPSVGTRSRVYAYNTGTNSYQVASGASSNGAGNWKVQLVFLTGPGVTVTATPGTPQTVFANEEGPGSTGFSVGSFELSTNAQGSVTVSDLTLKASGTGDDSTAFSEVTIYRDGNSDNTFNLLDDPVAVTSSNTFAADDGTIGFTFLSAEQLLPASSTLVYFVVVRLAATAMPGETFNFAVEDVVVSGGSKNGVPSAVMNGIVIDTPVFTVVDASSSNPSTVYLGTTGNVCQEFTLSYPAGPPDKPSNLSVSGLGTADESTDVAAIELWWDSDNSGDFDAGIDTPVDSQVFTQDNGVVDFDMTAHPAFQPGQTRRYFVTYDLNLNADDLETFQCYVSSVSGMALGGTANGVPAPSVNGTPGLEVSANVLIATLNGPTAAMNVNSNTSGASGDGVVLCDVTLAAAPGGAWTVNTLTFAASGTGSHNNAFAQLALHQDDGSTTFENATIDPAAAAPVTGFSGGVATFSLTTTAFPAGTSRRFFLVGKMNGSATTGQTFNAALDSVAATGPAGASTSGIPTAASTALVIDTAAVTVGNAPTQPATVTHPSGSPGSYVVARLRFNALNDAVDVTGVNLTTGGTGDWTSDVDSATGVQIYLDDGDGVFSATGDTQLYQGGGAAVITATFSSAVSMPVTSTADIWVRVGFTATAGVGALAAPETFTVSIASATDVSATAVVLLGTPAPNGGTIGAIEFAVSSFNPTGDLPKGGKAITIQGSGFVAPFTVKIGGVICPGTPVITGGTQVSGITVPPGGGNKLAIEITSGTVPPQVISSTFTYSQVGSTNGSSGGGGCSGGAGAAWVWVVAALLSAMLGCRLARRRFTVGS